VALDARGEVPDLDLAEAGGSAQVLGSIGMLTGFVVGF
jgi:hypothetical protein